MFATYSLGFLIFSLTAHFPLMYNVGFDKNTIWYFLHVICNTLVIYLTYEDLYICFTDTTESYNTALFHSSALGCTFGLHLYHIIISYKTLTVVDWLHHLISNALMVLTVVYYINIPVCNCGIFFMCGLPGGIDYLLLFLTKLKKINRNTEKYYNVYLNNWLRSPGILYCALLLHLGYINRQLDASMFVIYMSIFTIVFNAIYFAERVTINYGRVTSK